MDRSISIIRSMHVDPTADGRVRVSFKDDAGRLLNDFILGPVESRQLAEMLTAAARVAKERRKPKLVK